MTNLTSPNDDEEALLLQTLIANGTQITRTGNLSQAIPITTSIASRKCQHCSFYPAYERFYGYCSWDCYEEDED